MAQPDDAHSTEGFLGARFSREKHCLPEIVGKSGTAATRPNATATSPFPRR
jgi:hypothetical protein